MSDIKYHINAKGKREICHATERGCKFAESSSIKISQPIESKADFNNKLDEVDSIKVSARTQKNSRKFFADTEVLTKRKIAKVSVSPDELAELARDKDVVTRIGVAGNKLTASAVIEKLSKDKDWGVRMAVAKNPHTPQPVLQNLANDNNTWVRGELKNNSAYQKPGKQSIDIHSEKITALLKDAPVYNKFATVTAERVTTQREIKTIVGDGYVETTNTANVGDYIVTNPDGEQYILTEENFNSRYETTKNSGVYKATGSIKAIPNPFNSEIEIIAPWGSAQSGKEDCYIAMSVTNGVVNENDRYIVESEAFNNTYK